MARRRHDSTNKSPNSRQTQKRIQQCDFYLSITNSERASIPVGSPSPLFPPCYYDNCDLNRSFASCDVPSNSANADDQAVPNTRPDETPVPKQCEAAESTIDTIRIHSSGSAVIGDSIVTTDSPNHCDTPRGFLSTGEAYPLRQFAKVVQGCHSLAAETLAADCRT